MPTIKITAFSAAKLPSPVQLKTWVGEWSETGGVWNQFVTNNATATATVTGRTVQEVETTVDPTIDKYNESHPGNDMITVAVS